ncbi:hypothetical protein MNBD_GAMMA03-2083 [hydrothermal vent metagenome]|uniref:O-antigen ligase-related domain-containing protein n=1 Tax=hydrothermal vent metagenome TaxID=652676 RepID=A0A3B0WVH9_9ZZZZ
MSLNHRTHLLVGNIFLILTLGFCLLIGKLVTVLPSMVPVLLVFALFVFFLSIANTDLAMTLLIFAMLLSPELSLGAISKQRAVVIRVEDLLIVVFSLAWLAKTTTHGKIGFITKTPINRWIGFYISIFVLSTIMGMTSERLKAMTGIFYILKYLEYFFIYYLVCGLLKNKMQVKFYLKAFIITFAIVNIYAFLQIGSADRVSAPFEGEIGEPNTLGGYQILLLGIIIGILTHVKSLKWRLPLVGLTFFSLVPFAFTLSRASYMSILPMYFTLIFFNKFKTRNILIGFFIIFVILSFFFFPKNIKERIAYTFVAQEQETIKPVEIGGVTLGSSASARIQDWVRLFHKWKKRPFFGYGITGAGFVDSQFIRTLVELGLVGFSAFIGLLIVIFRRVLWIYRNTQDDWYKGIALGFLAGHVGMIFHATTANTFILIRIMEPYWFLAAIVMMIPKLEAMQKKEDEVVAVEKVKEVSVPTQSVVPRNVDIISGRRVNGN